MKSPLTIGMTAENQWALLFNQPRITRIKRIILGLLFYSTIASFSLTTDYSDFTDYFNKTSHWCA